jgi:hypothetical protein
VSNVAHDAVIAKRSDLAARSQILTAQWIAARDDQQARRVELNQLQADIAELDAWLAANPTT